jgi:hypothetical protein
MALVGGPARLLEAHCRRGLSRYTHVKADRRGTLLLDARPERRSTLMSLDGSTAPNMMFNAMLPSSEQKKASRPRGLMASFVP